MCVCEKQRTQRCINSACVYLLCVFSCVLGGRSRKECRFPVSVIRRLHRHVARGKRRREREGEGGWRRSSKSGATGVGHVQSLFAIGSTVSVSKEHIQTCSPWPFLVVLLCLMRGFHDDKSNGNPLGLICIFECNGVVELQPEIEWLNQ